MKSSARYLGYLACFGLSMAWAAPPVSAPQQEVTVVVVNAGVDPARPVQKVRVSLAYLDGATLITVTGATKYDATNSEGKATLLVALEEAQRGGLRINIDGAGNLVIYEPAEGQLTGLSSTVTIKLLPKGSPTLLEPAQFTAMLNRILLQEKQLNRENQQLKKDLAAAQSQKPDDMTVAITEWAKANGFEYDQVNDRIQQWANEIQQSKGVIEKKQKALAELALRHYDVAAELFDESADDIGQSMDSEQQKLLEDSRKQLRAFIDTEYQCASTNQLYLNYHKATLVLEKTRDRAAVLHGMFLPEDAALRSMWLEARERAADARVEEGAVGKAGDSAPLLTQSVADYKGLLRDYSLPAEREIWARTQNNLGYVLADRGERSSGAEVTDLFAQAVQAFKAALDVQTKANQPLDWARTQNNLGKARWYQGERSSGEQATLLFAEAVQAFNEALEVLTKADHRLDWAITLNNLGEVLRDQAERNSGEPATDLVVQSEKVLRDALTVETKAEMPQEWATTQNRLGYSLMDQATWSNRAQAAELLAQAKQAYQAALDIYTRTDLPQAWAWTQNNLGIALTEQGERSSGAQAADLLAQAVQAFQGALKMYPRADLPHAWAITQHYLGSALMDQGERSSGSQAAELFAQAVQAYQAALEVQTRADLPLYWATTEANLGRVLADQGDFIGASKALDASLELFPANVNFLQRAASTYQNKLYRYDRAYELTERWLKLDASPEARLSMAEEDLTTSRFAECEKQATAIGDAEFPAPAESMISIRDSMKLTCQWGAGEKAAAQETEKTLLPKAAGLQNTGWEFAGMLHYLASSSAFAAGRASWIALFDSLEKGDGPAMSGALNQLEEVMKH